MKTLSAFKPLERVSLPRKILRIANAMIGESLLPNFPAADLDANRVGIAAFDELQGTLQSDVGRRRQQQVHVVGH